MQKQSIIIGLVTLSITVLISTILVTTVFLPSPRPQRGTKNFIDNTNNVPTSTNPVSTINPEKTTNNQTSDTTPVYVTIISHNERGYKDLKTCDAFEDYRNGLLRIAEIVKKYDAKWDWQTDYLFLEAMNNCETESMRATTAGKNIAQYLVENMGVQADPHAHEDQKDTDGSTYLYADVAKMLNDALGGNATLTTVGGFEFANAEMINQLASGEHGAKYPSYFWKPTLLTMAANIGHAANSDDYTSGMWRPTGAGAASAGSAYLTHNPNGALAVVGSGQPHSGELGYNSCLFTYASDYTEALVNHIENGSAPSGKMYTSTLAITEANLLQKDNYDVLETMLKNLQPLVDDGKVIYATYNEAYNVWKNTYQEEPNIYTFFDHFSDSDYTCQQRASK